MRALVLCAGFGTRLGALTEGLAKPMLPLCGEPLLAFTLRHLARHGFDEVAVNLHHCGEALETYFGDGRSHGVSLRYSREDSPLGTAGALLPLQGFFAAEACFLVLYGDLLLDQDLGAMVRAHRERDAAATVLLHQRAGSNSLVQMDATGRLTGFVERPDEHERASNPYPWVHSGASVLSPRMLARIPRGRASDLPRDVYIPALRDEALYGFALTGYRCAVDSPARYAEAEAAVREGRYRGALP